MKGMAMKNTVGLMLTAALACAAGCPARAASVTLTSSSGDLTLAQALADAGGGSLAVATATGGIAGLPELVFAEGDRRGILRKSDDGKSLLLTVASGMMVIFR